MSNHNICFRGEIRKIFIWYPLLSRPMALVKAIFSTKMYGYFLFFLIFSTKTSWGYSWEAPGSPCKGLLMSTHNICFCREIWKIWFSGYFYYVELGYMRNSCFKLSFYLHISFYYFIIFFFFFTKKTLNSWQFWKIYLDLGSGFIIVK